VEFDAIQFDARFDIDRSPERADKNSIKALGLRERLSCLSIRAGCPDEVIIYGLAEGICAGLTILPTMFVLLFNLTVRPPADRSMPPHEAANPATSSAAG